MSYPGIDYGLGQSNIDTETGIRFGVISQHSISPYCMEDFELDYGDPHCPKCGNEIEASSDVEPDADWNDGKDYACSDCKQCYWSEECFPDESLGQHYNSDGYEIVDCLDTDLMVLKSPYFTYAQFCSPCVPGAGNLDSPVDAGTGAKCYALGPDWFDDNKAPYPLWNIADGSKVE